MSSYNQVVLVGNLARDPEVKHTSNGVGILSLTVITNEYNRTSKKNDIAMFHNVKSFKEQHVNFANYLKKGDTVLVQGSLQNRSWDDKDGKKCYATDINASQGQLEKFASGKASREAHDANDGGDPTANSGAVPNKVVSAADAATSSKPKIRQPEPPPPADFDDDSDVPF